MCVWFWLGCISVVSPPLYVKVPRLILKQKQTGWRRQSSFLEGIFCTARYCCRIFHQQSVKVYLLCTTGMLSRTLYAQHPVSLRIFPSLPGSRYDFLLRCKFSTLTSTPLYSSRLHAQNPVVIEIVHQESVKVYSTHTCEKQHRIDCAARVTAQNI